MKRIFYTIIIMLITIFILPGCGVKDNDKITKEMAYEGVSNYCHTEYDWSIAKDNPEIMYVEMGDETNSEYKVIFRSYTGAFVYFYVNKNDGKTKMIEYVPILDVENELGTINILDYIKK